ncbi:hypothetical protein X880_5951 [Burkholderia pseudomallei MSHR4032]|nr:hypothetical protein X880_5951 [Burkholderia pseudomallei MSHR4032]
MLLFVHIYKEGCLSGGLGGGSVVEGRYFFWL